MSKEKIKKARRLKTQSQRRPKDSLSYPELLAEIVKDTEFRYLDVKAVMQSMTKVIHQALIEKQQVRLPFIGTLYPVIKPSRIGMSLNGGVGKPTPLIVPDRWVLRLQPSQDIERELQEIEISKEELDNMYRK